MGGAAGAARLQGGSRAEEGGRVVLVGAQREAWRGGTLETGEGGGSASEKYRPFRRKITDEKYRC